MKLGKLSIFLGTLMFCLTVTAGSGVVFYVADNGNDAWSGRRSRPTLFKRDGPFATVSRALEATRSLRSTPGMARTHVTITLRRGTYFQNAPIILGPEDSNMTINGEGTLSGGLLITNWSSGSVNGHTALVAPVPGGLVFHQFWINGARATRARHPNSGYLSVASVPDRTDSWQKGQSRLAWKPGDLGDWKEIDPEAKAVVMSRWVESHLPIAALDFTNHLMSFGKKSVFQIDQGDLFYVEGVMEALDTAGEWFLDSREYKVYYLPRTGEDSRKLRAIVPVLSQVLRIEGSPGKKEYASGINFEGITFAHTEWNYAPPSGKAELDPGGSVQAAFPVPACVYAAGLLNSSFEKCTFQHLGGYSLELGPGCSKNLVVSCEFSDLGGGGLKVGEPTIRPPDLQTSNNEVRDCRLIDGGKVFHSAVGIWIGQSPNNRLIHNEIADFYYTGISVGWTWGYGPALATNNLVVSNRVHHIGRKSNGDGPILSDMGGIYTLGMQPGTRIVNNVWHDIAATRYGGWGIYFDEGSSSIVAASNLVYNTTHGGFHQHYGASNVVWNNIFALSRDHQLQRSRAEPHLSFRFETNIVFIDKGVLLSGNWTGNGYQMDHNLYFDARPGGETNKDFSGLTFEQFQQIHDTSSIFADPEFKNVDAFDFRLKEDSPAFSLGFHPIAPID